MDIKDQKAEYDKLKAEGKLSLRNVKSTNILDNPLVKAISESWKQHVDAQGITSVPFNVNQIIEESGVNMDFDHARDKTLRAFEVFALSQIDTESMASVKGFYGKETTTAIRKHLVRGKHIVVESNKELKKCFVSVNLSDLMPTAE